MFRKESFLLAQFYVWSKNADEIKIETADEYVSRIIILDDA